MKKVVGVGVSAAMLATLVATVAAPSVFAASATLNVTPASVTIPSAGSVNLTVSATGLTANAVVTITPSSGSVTPATLTADGSGAVSGTEAYTAAANGTTAPVTVTFSATDTASDTLTISNTVTVEPAGTAFGTNGYLVAVPGSATANGTDVVSITINPNAKNVGTVAGQLVSLTTTVGTFAAVTATGDTLWGTTPPTITALNVFGNSASLTGTAQVSLVAPTTAGTAIVQLNANGVLLDTVTVAFAASSTAATYMVIPANTPNPSTIPSTVQNGPSTVQVEITDSTNAPLANQIVTVSTNLGYLGTNGAGYCSNNSATADAETSCIILTDTSGLATAYLFAGGVGGTATVTFTEGTLSATETVTLAGAFSKVGVQQGWYSLETSGSAEVVAVLQPQDASGNVITNLPTSDFSVSVSSGIFTGTPTVGAYSDSATTNGSSYAGYPITLTCGANSGTSTVTVGVTNTFVVPNTTINGTFQVSCANSAASFTVTPTATSVAPGGNVTVTVKAVDSAGTPAPDDAPTTVSMFTNGVGNVVAAGGGTSADTSNGEATFYFLAPPNAGTAVLTTFVGGISAPVSTTITVGTGGAPAPTSASAPGTEVGLSMSGPFTTSTKLPKLGQYVTWKFSFGAAAAGQSVQILRAVKSGGVWSSFSGLTTRIADSNGDVYFHWRYSSAAWISVMASLSGTQTPARQARWL